jgi:hypothetical protein
VSDSFKQLLKDGEKAFKHLHKKGSYKPEDLKTENPYQNLIQSTFDAFDFAIKDNDMPEVMRTALQDDARLFGSLKANAQLFEASKMLLNTDGRLKPFSEVSKDFDKLNINYNQNYLEAEYEFAVASSQATAQWANLGDRYNLQYRTAQDERVRASHQVLADITLPKEDAFWSSFYPPNGWRCRCVAVEVLKGKYDESDSTKAITAGEKATTEIGKDGKNRLEIFRFNPGAQKVVFPPAHPYGKVKGAKEVRTELSNKTLDRYKETSFEPQNGIKNGGILEKFTTGRQNPQESVKNEKSLTLLANNGGHYRMLPVIEDGNKNPDALNLKTNQLVDIKVAETTNGKNIVQSALKEASKQGAEEVVIHLTQKPDSYRTMYGAVINTFKQGRAKNIQTITVINPDNTVREYDVKRFKKKKA